MSLKDTIKTMRDLLAQITQDLEKSDGGNKAASQRVRTGTVRLEKVAKLYRKESIKHEKTFKGARKKPAGKKPAAPKRPTAAAAPQKGKALPQRPQAKAHKAKARLLSFKKPSAKLLTKTA